jgi:hypothetical protein
MVARAAAAYAVLAHLQRQAAQRLSKFRTNEVPIMKTPATCIAALVATFAAGAFASFPTVPAVDQRVVTALQSDEGVPPTLVTAMRSDEGVPRNLVTAMKSDDGVPGNLVTAMKSDDGVPQDLVTA